MDYNQQLFSLLVVFADYFFDKRSENREKCPQTLSKAPGDAFKLLFVSKTPKYSVYQLILQLEKLEQRHVWKMLS